MITKARSISTRVLLFALSTGCAAVISASAFAAPPGPPAAGQTIEGCDKRVLDVAQAKARAMVVYDYAATEATIDKPDSQLAMTCFNNIAGVAGSDAPNDGGGSIFSGKLDGHYWAAGYTYPYNKSSPPVFTADTYYSDLIEQSLKGFYDEFVDADGNDGGTVDYTTTTLNDSTVCNEEQDLWGDPPPGTPTPGPLGGIRGEGVQGGVPFWDDDAIYDSAQQPADGDQDYQDEITKDAADIDFVKTQSDKLVPLTNGIPSGPGVTPITPVFTDGVVAVGAYNACNVLQTAGVGGACGPW